MTPQPENTSMSTAALHSFSLEQLCQELGLDPSTQTETSLMAYLRNLVRRAACLDLVETQLLTPRPEVSEIDGIDELEEELEPICLVKRDAAPDDYVDQFSEALEQIVHNTIASRKVPGAASLPADSSRGSWNEAVLSVYVTARKHAQSVPSNWLEHMKEALTAVETPSTPLITVERSLRFRLRIDREKQEELNQLSRKRGTALTDIRKLTSAYFSRSPSETTLKTANLALLEVETCATKGLLR